MNDIKQAVRELREALKSADVRGEFILKTDETFEVYRRDEGGEEAFVFDDTDAGLPLLMIAAHNHLPAVLDRLEELERIHGKVFKIMSGRAVPFEWIAPYESQAQRNHGQTLAQLDERGGLAPAEALCVVHGLSWRERKAQWKDDAVANADWETWCDNQASKRDAIRAKFAGLRKSISMAVDDSREHGSTGSVWSSHLEELLARFPALDSSETTDGREG